MQVKTTVQAGARIVSTNHNQGQVRVAPKAAAKGGPRVREIDAGLKVRSAIKAGMPGGESKAK